ncbi:MAG: beta-lactamase family protein [Ignavibacteriae bacterium]|nr:beta-lactamase family protein [Ignavibacteriota bacterium]MCB9214235.1 beta-lactamase family protein [Ignavibacteria bacterium]
MKPSWYVFLLAAIATAPHNLFSQQLTKAQVARIDSLFTRYDRQDSPGYALGIYRGGKLIYSAGYGMADLEHAVPITPQTRFDIGSTSKQFTATALLLLEQEGKLSLEDDVRKYIPELPDYGKPITVRHLLNHTSGLRDYIGLMSMSGFDIDDVTTSEDALRVIARQRALNFEPGTEHLYSNTGYFLGAVLVERVTGKTLREFAAERIFAPLGMAQTTYVDDHTEVLQDRAIAYSPGGDDAWHRDVSYWEQNGDGGIFTSVEDLLLWDENFFHPTVGGEKLNRELLRRGVLDNGDTLDYSLGLMQSEFMGIPVVSHGGSWGGYRAELMRIPSEHLSVALLSNCGVSNPSAAAERVLAIVLGSSLPPSTTSPLPSSDPLPPTTEVAFDPTLFDAYVGDYALDLAPDFVLTFRRDGDRYYSQATGQQELEILPSSDSTFFLKEINASMTFHREKEGSAQTVTLHQGGDYTAHRVVPFKIDAGALLVYTGEYYSDELETTYQLAPEGRGLIAMSSRGDSVLLTPVDTDRFVGSEWFLQEVEFERGSEGGVAAMVVSVGRVKNLRFLRKNP